MQSAVHVLSPARNPLQTLRLQKRSTYSRIRTESVRMRYPSLWQTVVVYLPLEDLIDREKEIDVSQKSRSDLQKKSHAAREC